MNAKTCSKGKITEVPSANQEIKPDSADETEKKSGAKLMFWLTTDAYNRS